MSIIYFILILSLVVFIHELGHFIFAKKAKIYVYEFSIGMGPQLFKFKRKNDETVYSLRLFPIGGFCSMAGETVIEDIKIPKNSRLQDKTWFQKFLTIIGGVMFNFIFAIFLFFLIGLFNGVPNSTPIVDSVKENGPAYKAGLDSNDIIKEINGVKVSNVDRFLLEYQVSYGEDMKIVTEDSVITITPTLENEVYSYGFSLLEEKEYGILESFKYGFVKFFNIIEQMYVMISYLITGVLSLDSLTGPIGIYNVTDQAASDGILTVISLIAYLSVNVGFINLLPIPAFDGGRIIFLLIEKIKGKPVSTKVENMVHMIGFIFLMGLMVIITYNDIVRFIIN